MKRLLVIYSAVILASVLNFLYAQSNQNLILNGGFESGFDGWLPLWTRDPNVGEILIDITTSRTGEKSAKIVHKGEHDWSLNTAKRIPVNFGEWFEYSAWFKLTGQGEAILCITTYDSKGDPLDWTFAEKRTGETISWTNLTVRFPIPNEVAFILARVIGIGPATVWVDDVSLRKVNITKPGSNIPKSIVLENNFIKATFETEHGTFNVVDKRNNHLWSQKSISSGIVFLDIKTNGSNQLILDMYHPQTSLELEAGFTLANDAPEILMELHSSGAMPELIHFPHPFVTEKGTYLVVPMNEGISYPVDDESIKPIRLIGYGGHGICMGFWGVTDGIAAQMTIIETPDDMSIQITRIDGTLAIYPIWEPQMGRFGYTRRLRYIFFNDGGHVAMCKKYREYSKRIGLFKTLVEKQRENPNVDLLIGAVNIWCWEKDAPAFVRQIKEAGIDKILWSNAQSPENIKKLNDMGVLTSRYDIYQDVMDPENFKYLASTHPDWPTEAWDKDIVIDSKRHWVRGWGVKGTNNQWYYCGVLCDKRAIDYAQKRVPAEIKTHDYKCRFIDTTTASPWRECYNTNHPMTRTESKLWRTKLLKYISEDMKLVTGSETGHEAAVPFLHYFEGMLSLGMYRVPDAGRNIQKIWDEAPEPVVKFQLGHRYRLPLWELVYHDCVVAQWYWGDYNNKLPALWDKRDLFNVLYGTPPMFMLNRQLWEKNKDRFVKSYKTVCPIVQKVGYYEMTNHRFLTPDRDIQQTEFANGIKITVNFGSTSYTLTNGIIIKPMDFYIQEK